MITSEKKAAVSNELRKHDKDNGSSAVQVGVITARIAELTEHMKTNKHDFAARRSLITLVGSRKKHLKFIAQKDGEAYLALIKKLGIRR